jgi:hypothetical protein
MPRYSFLIAAVAVLLTGLAPAGAQQMAPPPQQMQPPPAQRMPPPQQQVPAQPQQQRVGPCTAIRMMCEQAGFIRGGTRDGVGIVADCIRPIMMGRPQPRRATKPLPVVDPRLVEACKARNPTYGMPRERQPQAAPGTAPQMAPPPGAPNEEEPPQDEPPPPKR